MKKLNEFIKETFKSKTLLVFLCAIAAIVLALLIFSAGVTVGFRKASFMRAWGDNYTRNFGFTPNIPSFGGDNLPNSNGAVGRIVQINLPEIIVADKSNTEKIVLIGGDTRIEKMRNPVSSDNLKVDDFVVVIGNPNEQGQLEAKFIRIMPVGMPIPPGMQSTGN